MKCPASDNVCLISDSEIERFSRQMVLTGWGGREQSKLKTLSVVVEGRFISAAIYLAAAGVGELIIVSPVLSPKDPVVAHISALNPGTAVILVRSTADLPVRDDLVFIGTDCVSGDGSPNSNPLTYRGIRIEPGTKNDSIRIVPISGHSGSTNVTGASFELFLPSLLSPDLFVGAAAASAVIKDVLRASK